MATRQEQTLNEAELEQDQTLAGYRVQFFGKCLGRVGTDYCATFRSHQLGSWKPALNPSEVESFIDTSGHHFLSNCQIVGLREMLRELVHIANGRRGSKRKKLK